MRAFARDDNDNETEITEGVQALYDMVIGSMDWGSAFFTYEDALPVAQIGQAMGFEKIDEIVKYLAAAKRAENLA